MSIDEVKAFATRACILLTITAFLFGLVEIGSYIALKRLNSETPDRALNAYRAEAQPWAKTLWREYDASKTMLYEPYVVWRRAPFDGKTIVVDAEGLRHTDHSTCDGKAYTIYMFGGSTLWGTGSPNWGTIPSLLAEMYEKSGRSVCVKNFGESAWVSTQQTIKLLLELKSDARKPDLVIFYDGVNDVMAAWQSGGLDVHQNFGQIKAQFESRGAAKGGTFHYLLLTNTAQLLQRWAARGPRVAQAASADAAQFAHATADHYLRNIAVIDALSRQYGFKYVLFWQPVIYAESKPLTAHEQRVAGSKNRSFAGLQGLFQTTYGLIHREKLPNLFYIADVFNGYSDTLYLDFAHVTPDGNRLVAGRMYETLHRLGL
jgi:lysophospholipase L1-like esterase